MKVRLDSTFRFTFSFLFIVWDYILFSAVLASVFVIGGGGGGCRRLKLSADCYSWAALFITRCRMGCTNTPANDSPPGLEGG